MVSAGYRISLRVASLLLLSACSTPQIRSGTYDIVYFDVSENVNVSEQIIVFDEEIDLGQFPAVVVYFEGNRYANIGRPQKFKVCVVKRSHILDDGFRFTNVGFTNQEKVDSAWKVVTLATPDFRSWLLLSANKRDCNAFDNGDNYLKPRRCQLIRRGEPRLKICQDAGLEMDEQTRP